MQECGAGLVPIRRTDAGLAFAAPPLIRSGPVEEALLVELAAALGIGRADIVDAAWADNGPGWVALLLADAEAVLALRPAFVDATSAWSARTRPAARPPASCARSSPATARRSRIR